jgi:phospholipid/cholesterol/gamma-HCH transport system substrate-binding protein
VGSVTSTELAPDGRGVNILLRIERQYRIHRDAQFNVEQIGLLGDQFVVINPGPNQAPILQEGDEVACQPPFNIQSLAVTAVGFIQRVDDATRMLKETITRVNQLLLTDETLTNLAAGLGSVRAVSARAQDLMDNLDRALETNAAPVHVTLTNLARFSGELNGLSTELRTMLAENRPALASTLTNLESSTRSLQAVARDLESGRGLAGTLLQDDQARSNLNATLQNLAILSSNLNKYGLLYKPKPVPASSPRAPYPGYSPARP